MKKLILCLMVAVLAGCEKAPERTIGVNQNFQVDTLFTHEGCTVYRFQDAGRNRYYTNCAGETGWEEACGKYCISHESISTRRNKEY